MNPADDRSIESLRPEDCEAIHGKQSASSDEDGSVGQPDSTSDHSMSEKGHSGPSSDDETESRVEDARWFVDTAPLHAAKRRSRRKVKGGRHHRRMKPYEKTEEDANESQRRKVMQAPENTTQFIMEDHSKSSPGTNTNTTDETITRGMSEFDRQYADSLAKEYSQAYTKKELILKVMELESKVGKPNRPKFD